MPVFTPRDPSTGKRHKMEVSFEDARKTGRGSTWRAVITDQKNGKRYAVQGAPCSAGPQCYCDAVAIEIAE